MTQQISSMRVAVLLCSVVATVGCGNLGSRLCCSTNAGQRYFFGHEAVRIGPCGPDEAFHGHKPTHWRPWPADWQLCQYPVEAGHYLEEAPTDSEPVEAERPVETSSSVRSLPTVPEESSGNGAPGQADNRYPLQSLPPQIPPHSDAVPIETEYDTITPLPADRDVNNDMSWHRFDVPRGGVPVIDHIPRVEHTSWDVNRDFTPFSPPHNKWIPDVLPEDNVRAPSLQPNSRAPRPSKFRR